MYINHNQMATNVANTLTSHYGNLATSTQRLSSGLRVNSAADDAAGLAIRELMRADIAALNQGVRNANDAISLIQTADGALGVIDEKLIRMKELAEQAATGTYDSTQRLMIESEYQQMASEITRIANATDFNGIKLLNGNLDGTHKGDKLDSEGALKVHFGTMNDSAEDYYYIEISEVTAAALGVGNESKFEDVKKRAAAEMEASLKDAITSSKDFSETQKGILLSQVDAAVDMYKTAIDNAIDPQNAHKYWAPDTAGDTGFLSPGKEAGWPVESNSTLMNDYLAVAKGDPYAPVVKVINQIIDDGGYAAKITTGWTGAGATTNNVATENTTIAGRIGTSGTDANTLWKDLYDANVGGSATDKGALGITNADIDTIMGNINVAPRDDTPTDLAGAQKQLDDWTNGLKTTVATDLKAAVTFTNEEAINTFWTGLSANEQEKLKYAFGTAAIYNLGNAAAGDKPVNYGIEAGDFATVFGLEADGTTAIAKADDVLKKALEAGYNETKDMDFAGYTIETQEDAQHALVALNDAIVQKDKVRAHLGALQNRLENTVTNLTVQSENLQAAESRISDVDVATEMTNFVRNQILTQSAVAMLSQANSMPQMAMQLIR